MTHGIGDKTGIESSTVSAGFDGKAEPKKPAKIAMQQLKNLADISETFRKDLENLKGKNYRKSLVDLQESLQNALQSLKNLLPDEKEIKIYEKKVEFLDKKIEEYLKAVKEFDKYDNAYIKGEKQIYKFLSETEKYINKIKNAIHDELIKLQSLTKVTDIANKKTLEMKKSDIKRQEPEKKILKDFNLYSSGVAVIAGGGVLASGGASGAVGAALGSGVVLFPLAIIAGIGIWSFLKVNKNMDSVLPEGVKKSKEIGDKGFKIGLSTAAGCAVVAAGTGLKLAGAAATATNPWVIGGCAALAISGTALLKLGHLTRLRYNAETEKPVDKKDASFLPRWSKPLQNFLSRRSETLQRSACFAGPIIVSEALKTTNLAVSGVDYAATIEFASLGGISLSLPPLWMGGVGLMAIGIIGMAGLFIYRSFVESPPKQIDVADALRWDGTTNLDTFLSEMEVDEKTDSNAINLLMRGLFPQDLDKFKTPDYLASTLFLDSPAKSEELDDFVLRVRNFKDSRFCTKIKNLKNPVDDYTQCYIDILNNRQSVKIELNTRLLMYEDLEKYWANIPSKTMKNIVTSEINRVLEGNKDDKSNQKTMLLVLQKMIRLSKVLSDDEKANFQSTLELLDIKISLDLNSDSFKKIPDGLELAKINTGNLAKLLCSSESSSKLCEVVMKKLFEENLTHFDVVVQQIRYTQGKLPDTMIELLQRMDTEKMSDSTLRAINLLKDTPLFKSSISQASRPVGPEGELSRPSSAASENDSPRSVRPRRAEAYSPQSNESAGSVGAGVGLGLGGKLRQQESRRGSAALEYTLRQDLRARRETPERRKKTLEAINSRQASRPKAGRVLERTGKSRPERQIGRASENGLGAGELAASAGSAGSAASESESERQVYRAPENGVAAGAAERRTVSPRSKLQLGQSRSAPVGPESAVAPEPKEAQNRINNKKTTPNGIGSETEGSETTTTRQRLTELEQRLKVQRLKVLKREHEKETNHKQDKHSGAT